MRHIPDASDSLLPFIQDVVALGAVILTDGWGGYNKLPEYGYTYNLGNWTVIVDGRFTGRSSIKFMDNEFNER